jgi:low affinity Fe/Cu permease
MVIGSVTELSREAPRQLRTQQYRRGNNPCHPHVRALMSKLFTKFANAVAAAAGSPYAFMICTGWILLWALSGPFFGFSNTWQLVINTSTTIVTFLMVFIIQNTQNRDNGALHAKLDELIRASDTAENEYIGIEHLTDEELQKILERVEKNAEKLHSERKRRKPAAK